LKDLGKELQQRKADHLYRRRRISDSAQQVEMLIDGRKVISFCSNDYLGLASHPAIKQAFIQGIEQYGVGSGAAHLINGHSRAHHQLEEALAEFTGYPRALLFSTGYMANLGVAQALLGKGDSVLEDRLNHASLIDGGLLSGARLLRYQHKNYSELADKLAARNSGEKLVMSDGVFSMDGDIADASTLTDICQYHDAWLMLDDAHGFGVLGEHGAGILSHNRVKPGDVPIYMATLGKAVGTAGAFVAGSEELIETLIQQARTYIYTTAQPPAIAVATLESLRIIKNEPERRAQLHSNIAYFRSCAQQSGLAASESETAIQPIIIGDSEKTIAISQQLFDQGLQVTAIRPPTVPQDTARLRITLSAAHTREHIDRLVSALGELNIN
jgi:8-amino-7-oxononanoate synthase